MAQNKNAPIPVFDHSYIEHSMLTNMTTAGVDDWLFVINACVSIVFVFGLKVTSFLGFALLAHGVLFYVSRVSPNILEKYIKYIGQAPRYGRNPRIKQTRGLRPFGFGRGVCL